jgi:hypothetical protein
MWREVRPLRELWVTDTPRDIIDAMVTGQSAIDAGTDLPAPTAFRPPRAGRRVKPKPKDRWRYPEGLALKHRPLHRAGYRLEDVTETSGSHPDDLCRVLEVGIAIR